MKITKTSVCPVCGDRLNISKLSCPSCKAEFPVEENISEYDRLDAAQSDFLRTFLTCRGNMKDVQNKIGISYPTAKKRLDELLLKKVWLPCGANIVIEPTEALTVIDVNTGKSIRDKKTKEEHFLFVNKEAAKEIARQLKLRNLSGIIIVDFIDMKQDESTKELLSYFSSLVHQDPVPTMIVGMTPLHLCEITRKKVQKPLHEQWNRALSVAK